MTIARERVLLLEINKLRAALRALVQVTERTAQQLEEASEGLKECGYWNRDEKDAFERGKELGRTDRAIPGYGSHVR